LKDTQKLKRAVNKNINKIAILPEEPILKGQTISFSGLRDNLNQLVIQSGRITSRLDELSSALQVLSVQNWNKESDSKKRYLRIIGSIFFLLDQLENRISVGENSKEIGGLLQNISRVIEDEDIVEIPIKKWEPFNASLHKKVGSRPDDHKANSILEIIRKGYFIRGFLGQENTTLRQAEVIVSEGPVQRSHKLKNSKEAEK